MPTANIVQAEFFHVGGEGIFSFEDLKEEIQERRLYGGNIKTTVRFFDEIGAITSYVSRMQRLRLREQELSAAFARASGWRRRWLSFRHQHIAGKQLMLEVSAKQLTIEWLGKTIQAEHEIAVELPDRRFRIAKDEELHELLEAVKRSKRGVWLYVFQPNFLLADSNRMIAYAM